MDKQKLKIAFPSINGERLDVEPAGEGVFIVKPKFPDFKKGGK